MIRTAVSISALPPWEQVPTRLVAFPECGATRSWRDMSVQDADQSSAFRSVMAEGHEAARSVIQPPSLRSMLICGSYSRVPRHCGHLLGFESFSSSKVNPQLRQRAGMTMT
jgi:hypothetical protein